MPKTNVGWVIDDRALEQEIYADVSTPPKGLLAALEQMADEGDEEGARLLALLRGRVGGLAHRGSPDSGYHPPHYGRPGQVGGSRPRGAGDIYDELPWQLRPQTATAVFRCLKCGLDTGCESAIVIKRNGEIHKFMVPFGEFEGRVVEHFKGGTNTVTVFGLQDIEDEFIWVHNHPNSSGLSPADIWALWSTDTVHMIVVGQDGALFRISRTPDTIPADSYRAVMDVWQNAYHAQKPTWKQQVKEGLSSPPKAHRELTIIATQAVADKYKLDHEVVLP